MPGGVRVPRVARCGGDRHLTPKPKPKPNPKPTPNPTPSPNPDPNPTPNQVATVIARAVTRAVASELPNKASTPALDQGDYRRLRVTLVQRTPLLVAYGEAAGTNGGGAASAAAAGTAAGAATAAPFAGGTHSVPMLRIEYGAGLKPKELLDALKP